MAEKYDILVLNGPNLKYIGKRQPEIYGERGLDLLPELLRAQFPAQAENINLIFFQHNHEGALIDRLEQAHLEKTSGVALNAGAFSHTSLALADCLAWINIPTVEVHLSNVQARPEKIRHKSLIAPHCLGVISGFGLQSYVLAVMALWAHLK